MKALFEFITGAVDVKPPELDKVGGLFCISSAFVEPKLKLGLAKVLETIDGLDAPNANVGAELVFNETLWVVSDFEMAFVPLEIDGCDVWEAENAKPPSLGELSVVFEVTIVLFGDVRLFGIVGIVNDDVTIDADCSVFAGSLFV